MMVRRRIGKVITRIGIVIAVVVLLWLGFALGFAVLLGACDKEAPQKGIERIENAIGVSLPEDAEVEYHYYSVSPDSSYSQYTVIKLQSIPEDFLRDYPLVQAAESWGSEEFVRYVKGRRIKEKYIPSFDEPWMSSELSFSGRQSFQAIYFPNSLTLIFYIIFVG